MQNTFLNDMQPSRVTEMQQYQNGVRKHDWSQESLTAGYMVLLASNLINFIHLEVSCYYAHCTYIYTTLIINEN